MQSTVAPPPTQAPAGRATQPAATPVATTTLSVPELRAKRSEISSQISNVTSRRDEIASQVRAAAPGADRIGLERRLASLDDRLVQLEGELNATGQQLANARGLAAVTEQSPPTPPGELSSGQITAISIVFTFAVLMPLSIAWARALFRRSAKRDEQPSKVLMARLDRMEEGIETIALEVERISEGQRFVTKVIGGGAAEPVAIPRGENVEVQR